MQWRFSFCFLPFAVEAEHKTITLVSSSACLIPNITEEIGNTALYCHPSCFGGAVLVCKPSWQFVSKSVYKNLLCISNNGACTVSGMVWIFAGKILSADCFPCAVGKIHHSNTWETIFKKDSSKM